MVATPAPATDPLEEMMARRIAGFARTLRGAGFSLGLAESRDALALLGSPAARSADRLRAALRALFCSRRSEWEQFDGLFDAFWLGRGTRVALRQAGAVPRQARPRSIRGWNGGEDAATPPPAGIGAGDHSGPDQSDGEADGAPAGQAAARHEVLVATDMRHIVDPAETAILAALAERLARRMRRRIRRQIEGRAGRRLDVRRTIHRSIGRGGVPLSLVTRRRRRRRLRPVVLLDVSGSMAPYTPILLRFLHGLLQVFGEADAFLFHTRLIHVAPGLRERDAGRALERLSLMAEGIGGGTAIGASLASFEAMHARRCLGSRSVLIIVSDGYDTGEPAVIAEALQRLRRRCRRIAWLNPMAGWAGYRPEARGMQAALPHVDLFAPAHDLRSLLALEPFLARL